MCDWHCRTSRSAGTPRHWSRCFHRNPLQQQNCVKGKNHMKLINTVHWQEKKCSIKSLLLQLNDEHFLLLQLLITWIYLTKHKLTFIMRQVYCGKQIIYFEGEFLRAGQTEIWQWLMKHEGAMLVSVDEELRGISVRGNHLLSPHTAVHPK